MNTYRLTRYRFRQWLWAIVILLIAGGVSPALGEEHPGISKPSTSTFLLPIKMFQKSISKADGDRCPMYPSCSHYASTAFKRHGAVMGLILSYDRLLRCGRDEIHLSPKIRIKGRTRVFDSIEGNTRWWSKDLERN